MPISLNIDNPTLLTLFLVFMFIVACAGGYGAWYFEHCKRKRDAQITQIKEDLEKEITDAATRLEKKLEELRKEGEAKFTHIEFFKDLKSEVSNMANKLDEMYRFMLKKQ